MGQVWWNPIQRTVKTAHLSVLMTVHSSIHNTTQNSSDNLPSYLHTNIIAQRGTWLGHMLISNDSIVKQHYSGHCEVIEEEGDQRRDLKMWTAVLAQWEENCIIWCNTQVFKCDQDLTSRHLRLSQDINLNNINE